MTTPTHSQPSETAKQKRPKGRALYAYDAGASVVLHDYRAGHCKQPVAVLPAATRKQAQQIVRWANLSREQKVEAIAKALCQQDGYAWSGLSAIGKWPYQEQAIVAVNLPLNDHPLLRFPR